METTTERFVTDDKVVRVTTTKEPRVVDFDDIEGSVEYDEYFQDAPWDYCDGWEHEFIESRRFDHDGYEDSVGAVCRSYCNESSGFISIDDSTVVGWGCDGYPGCSKQVRAESISRAKRKATEQLVKWYENGWEWYVASAEYGDYADSVSGIDCTEYAKECAKECRRVVAAEMERDGYIVENKPEPPKPYNAVDSFRDLIHRNLDCSFC